MAYFEQTLMSATPGGTSGTNDVITMVNGAIADSFINKSVTYDDQPSDLANPKVKLAGEGELVIGSIVGVSYGKLQIAVDGWDIKFMTKDGNDLTPGSRIVGAEISNEHGFVKAAPSTFSAVARGFSIVWHHRCCQRCYSSINEIR